MTKAEGHIMLMHVIKAFENFKQSRLQSKYLIHGD